MHLLPRFFTHSSNSLEPMDPSRRGKAKPRLERRNAVKHFDYDAASSSSSTEGLSVSSSSFSLVTRSLELHNRTSFRIQGIDGEFDRICRRLGLSGPDDFAITVAAWEACKAHSSSDLLPRIRSLQLCSMKKPADKAKEEEEESEAGSCRAVADSVRDGNDTQLTRLVSGELNGCGDCSISAGGEFCIRDIDGCRTGSTNGREVARNESAESGAFCIPIVGGGIKGERPPVLKPPPAMTLQAIDEQCSTWDFLRDFAPESERGSLAEARRQLVSSSSSSSSEDDYDGEEDEEEEQEQEEEQKEKEEQEEEERADRRSMKREEEENVLRLGDTSALSESCSFSRKDDDSSSTILTFSPQDRFKWNITSWQKGQLLGRGSFGSVYAGISNCEGFFFAIKEVSLLDQGSQAQQSIHQLEQEIALLSKFEHENIVRYYGTDKDKSTLYIFLELVSQGSLLNLYKTYQLQDSQVSAYTRQILHGLKYLHDQDVIHRDIKCANILVDTKGSVKLADFGLAKATKFNDIKSCKGTPFWMAPEVVNNRKKNGYGLPADIWSLGCTVLEMLTRQIPYSDLEPVSALFRIGKGIRPSVPDHLSKEARDFILQCLKVKADERPTAAKLLSHPFLRRPLPTSSGSASPYLQKRV